MKKLLIAALLVVLLGAFAACGEGSGNPIGLPEPGDDGITRIRIGASIRPHSEILEYIAPYLLAEDNIRLEIREFPDFHLINPALADGSLDASYFQHLPFLQNSPYADRITMLGLIHIEPMGAYSRTISDISELPYGAMIAMPNDLANNGRSLLLLQAHGILTVDPAAGVTPSEFDITDNPLNLRFTSMNAELLPRALDDPHVDVAIINTNHVIASTDLNPMRDSLIIESPDSPYANGLTVRNENANSPVMLAILRHLQSERVRAFIYREYDGAVVPVF